MAQNVSVKVLAADELLSKIEQAGLVGRGGAAFPVHLKWQRIKNLNDPKKYVVCNASEGEIGVKKDFYILEHFFKEVLEGILLTMDFLETKEAYININKNYYQKLKAQIDALIEPCNKRGYLIHIFEEQPSYIGGETGALLNAIEGKKTQPRLSPPSPSITGIFHCPVLLHNVETFYDIARVANDRYLPTRFSTILGTQNAGVYQVEIEQKVAEILRETNNYPTFAFFVQVGGGASGEVITASQAEDMKLSGAGSIEIYPSTTTAQQFLGKILNFYAEESCGKCTPCRDGSWQLQQIIEKLAQDQVIPWSRLSPIVATMEQSSFCGLGKSIAVPIKSYAKNILGLEV